MLQVEYVVYVAASETGILYIAVVNVPFSVANVCMNAKGMAAEESTE